MLANIGTRIVFFPQFIFKISLLRTDWKFWMSKGIFEREFSGQNQILQAIEALVSVPFKEIVSFTYIF